MVSNPFRHVKVIKREPEKQKAIFNFSLQKLQNTHIGVMAVVFKQKSTCLAFLPGIAGGKQGKNSYH